MYRVAQPVLPRSTTVSPGLLYQAMSFALIPVPVNRADSSRPSLAPTNPMRPNTR